MKIPFFIFVLFAATSFSQQIKFKGKKNSDVNTEDISKVFFLTQFDSIPDSAKYFGNFTMKENDFPQWDTIWRELKRFAATKGCNGVKIDGYHTFLQTRGNKVYLEGR